MRRGAVASLLIATLTACAPYPWNIRQTSPLVDGLSVSTREEDNYNWTAKVTLWRDRAETRAWLRVEYLKGQYGSSRMFYIKSLTNSLQQTVRDSGLLGGYYAYQTVEEGAAKNGIGNVEFVHLKSDSRSCVYTLQYWGASPRYENSTDLLGHTKIESWYCADSLSREDIDSFVKGLSM